MQKQVLIVHSDFYPQDKIMIAAEEFRNYADITIEVWNAEQLQVTISSEEDIDTICKEFLNFVLSF